MAININLDEEKITDKVTSDELGLFISNEWKRLIDPYTPRDTGTLMGLTNQVELKPFKIWYKSKYAVYVYYGEKMNFRKINPFSTHHWDKAAENAGQKNKLYTAINAHLKSK